MKLSLVLAACLLAAGCAAPTGDAAEEETGASTDAITDVNHSKVKRQSTKRTFGSPRRLATSAVETKSSGRAKPATSRLYAGMSLVAGCCAAI